MPPNPIGVMLNNLEADRLKAFPVAAELGFQVVHTNALPTESWLQNRLRESYIQAARASGLTVASLFVGFDGQRYANLKAIRNTVGLVQPQFQKHRTQVAKLYADLAQDLGGPSISLHLGFFPTRASPAYRGLISAIREIADYCLERKLTVHLETGQEPASVLKEFILEIGQANLGVNFDPGNFVLYGSDDPHSALETLSPWVKGVHCKDALPPHCSDELGTEMPVGMGKVDIPKFLSLLKKIGYRGPLILERECGSDRVGDILRARDFLRGLLSQT